MTIRQMVKDIFNEIDDIRHPPTETITISELEEKLMEYEGEIISITYPRNTTQAWESEDLSSFDNLHRRTFDIIREGKPTEFNRIIEDLGLSQETRIRFIKPESNDRWERIQVLYGELNAIVPRLLGSFDITETQTTLAIEIDDDPIIAILGDFKKMCRRSGETMLRIIQNPDEPRSAQEAPNLTITQIYRNWETRGGYRDEIATIKRVCHDDIKCDFIGDDLRKLRHDVEHEGHNATVNQVTNVIERLQRLTPEDIRIEQ